MKSYVVSKSSNRNFALEPKNIVAVCSGWEVDALGDAMSYAKDEAAATDNSAFVYEVEIKLAGSYKVQVKKELIFVPAE